jgi:hypothetical protein
LSSHAAEFTNILQESTASIFRVSRKYGWDIGMKGKDMVLGVKLWETVEPRGGKDKHVTGSS